MTGSNHHNLPSWVLNDIAWLGSAPGLLRDSLSSLNVIRQTCSDLTAGRVRLSDDQLSVLTVRRCGPLGRYFEALVQAVIAVSAQVSRYHPNVVIHDGERTRGELDLLYETAGRWVHLELAVKFYLGVGDRRDPFQWHGPAARDTLGRKLKRMFGHQLPLPRTDAGKAALTGMNIGEVHSEALVMGMLFHPFAQWRDQKLGQDGILDAPDTVAENHPAGWWLCQIDAYQLQEAPQVSWRILSKPEWLSPVKVTNEEMLSNDGLSEHLKATCLSRPIMVAALTDDTECHRGFIVPDDWPPTAEES